MFYVFFLDSDKYTVIGGMLENETLIDSTGASYIYFAFSTTQYPVADYEVFGDVAKVYKDPYISDRNDLSNNDSIYLGNAK